MLSIGMWEMVVIAGLALVVVGPERLPKVMRFLGKQYGMVRRAANDMRRAFVLEADRQDAEERYKKLQERREKAREEREAALKAAGEGAQAQDAHLPPPANPPPEAPEDAEELEPEPDPEARPIHPSVRRRSHPGAESRPPIPPGERPGDPTEQLAPSPPPDAGHTPEPTLVPEPTEAEDESAER